MSLTESAYVTALRGRVKRKRSDRVIQLSRSAELEPARAIQGARIAPARRHFEPGVIHLSWFAPIAPRKVSAVAPGTVVAALAPTERCVSIETNWVLSRAYFDARPSRCS